MDSEGIVPEYRSDYEFKPEGELDMCGDASVKVAIIFDRFLDREGQEQHIGGVETYIRNLADLCIEKNWMPILFQCSTNGFKKTVNGLQITGVPTSSANIKQQKQLLYQAALLKKLKRKPRRLSAMKKNSSEQGSIKRRSA